MIKCSMEILSSIRFGWLKRTITCGLGHLGELGELGSISKLELGKLRGRYAPFVSPESLDTDTILIPA